MVVIDSKEFDHPDLKENDIDLCIGVNDEQEWGRISQKVTKFLEHWGTKDDPPSVKCFVKTTVQQWHIDE